MQIKKRQIRKKQPVRTHFWAYSFFFLRQQQKDVEFQIESLVRNVNSWDTIKYFGSLEICISCPFCSTCFWSTTVLALPFSQRSITELSSKKPTFPADIIQTDFFCKFAEYKSAADVKTDVVIMLATRRQFGYRLTWRVIVRIESTWFQDTWKSHNHSVEPVPQFTYKL